MVKNTGKELYVSDIPPELTALLLRFATCIPSKCSENDAMLGMTTFLEESGLGQDQGFTLQSFTFGCQAGGKEFSLTPWDWAMIIFLSVMGLLISVQGDHKRL